MEGLARQGEHWLPYFAGLFDGEGTIAAYPRGGRGKPRPFVKINMTCRETIDTVATHFGGNVLVKKVYGNSKPQWHWVASCNRAIVVTHALLPYLITKREAALILLEKCSYGVQGSHTIIPALTPPDDPLVTALLKRPI